MKPLLRSALLTFVAGALLAPAGAHAADSIYGVTAKNLVRFSSADPSTAEAVVPIAIASGQTMAAIDVRPADGRIFGLTTDNQFISIDPATGAVTNKGFPTPAGATRIDFNPAVDRLRVVTDANKNYRLNPDDASLTQDTDLSPAGAVAGIAYDRNVAGTQQTTLFGIDSGTDSLIRIGGEDGTPSPNGGQVTTLGALGVDTGAAVGFDISPSDGRAYATLPVAGKTGLYTVNLSTGAATKVGDVPTSAGPIVDIAVAQPELTVALAGGNASNVLVRTSGTNPSTGIAGNVAFITGLQTNENVIGLDVRPATGELIAVTSANRIYSVDPVSGSAVVIGSGFGPPLGGGGTGADFDPVTGSLRLVDATEKNQRVDPLTGLTIAVDGPLTPAGEITGAAYSPGPNPVLFDIDSAANALYRQDPPNTGALTSVGGLAVNNVSGTPALDLQPVNGFDIPQSGGAAFLVTRDGSGGTTNLYRVLTGTTVAGARAHLVGLSVVPLEIAGLAVLSPGTLATGPATAAEGDGTATVVVTRSAGTTGRATVEYATVDGTAKAGEDYTAVRGVVRFAEGQSVKTISVPVTDDSAVEPTETFGLTLTRPGEGALLGTPATATVKLISDDAAPAPTATADPSGTATPGPSGTATPTPAPTDTTKPLAFVAVVPGQSLRSSAKHGLRAQVVTGEPATASLTSKLGKRKLKPAKVTFTASGVKTVTVKLSKTLRKKLLKAKRAARLVLKVVVTDTAGNAATASATAVLPRR